MNQTSSLSPTDADRDLMERFRTGDRGAFSQLVREHQTVIFGYLRTRVLQMSDAEDLAQEVFLRFYVNRDRFDPAQPVRPWLLGIARNLLREHVRKLNKRKEVAWTGLCLELDDMMSFGEHDEYEDALQFLPECLESLGPSARKAVSLKYQKDLKLVDIGEELHRSEGAVKLLMFRARQALRHCLNGKLRRTNHD